MKKINSLIFAIVFLGTICCDAQTYTNLVSVANTAIPYGSYPYGDLLNVGGNLYGMTEEGGINDLGVLFSYNIIGNTYTGLESFNIFGSPKGEYPYGHVIDVAGVLYGMTENGGAHGEGVFFSYNIGTSTYTDLYDFSGGTGGANPYGSLVAIGNVLYGLTEQGGTNGVGNIFSYNIGTSTYTNLYSFTSATGELPYGSLTVDGSILYGMTFSGGTNGDGVIFSFNPTGNVYNDLVNLDGTAVPKGSNPQYGSLTLYNSILYGMTYGGGTNGDGVIFSYNPGISTYTDLYDFSGGTGGKFPYGSLLLSGNTFFGMTEGGGASNEGNIFSFDISTSTYTNLYGFTGGANGAYPHGSLILSGNVLYGMTEEGGLNNVGNIFSFSPACTLTASAAATSNVLCNGASDGIATATVSGGTTIYTYSWSNGSSTVSTSNPTGAVLSAGSYTVTVTDNTAICTATATVTITQVATTLADGAPTLNSDVLCFGGNGSATAATATGGTAPYTYAWNGGATSTNVTNTSLSAGTYTVNVTDAHGCVVNSAGTVTITQPAATLADGAPTLNSNVPCFGGDGSATAATPTGGTAPYTYAWNGGATSTNVTNTSLSAGTYTVNVTDANGCMVNSSGTVTITQPAATLADGSPTLNSNVPCFGGEGSATAATPTGGTAPYTYAWNGGATSTNVTNTSLSAGTYTVNVTDANGCMVNSSGTVTITQPAAVTALSFVNNDASACANSGSATVTPGGGNTPYTYSWTGGNTNATATGLSIGSYTVTVIDDNGCSASSSITITQPTALGVTSNSVNDNSKGACNGQATANVSGGTAPYTYKWSPGGGTNDTINGKCSGHYCCVVTDNLGCKDSTCVTIVNTTGIDNIDGSSSLINVYPDPNTGYFTITGLAQGQEIEIYNSLGQKIKSKIADNSTMQFDISSYGNGIYLINIQNKDGSRATQKKIIKTQ